MPPASADPITPAQPSGPRHVAIIMDGNGRWAKARGMPRALGHREGVQALKRTVEAAPGLGVECLTVFGFSTENWRRPAQEVSELMGLVKLYVQTDLARLTRVRNLVEAHLESPSGPAGGHVQNWMRAPH